MDKYENESKIAALRNNEDKLCHTLNGIDWDKENLADWILAQGRKGVVKHSELRDYLTPSQLELRRSREVYPSQGHPEEHLYSGLFRRAYNPQTRGTRSSKASPNLDHDGGDNA